MVSKPPLAPCDEHETLLGHQQSLTKKLMESQWKFRLYHPHP